MQKKDRDFSGYKYESLAGTMFVMVFGFFILASLIVIDRYEWLTIQPKSGMATAMAYTASNVTSRAE